MNITKKLVDQIWDKYFDLEDEYLTLGQDIIPYIENRQTANKITEMFDSIVFCETFGDKEYDIEQKLLELIEKESEKIKNESLKQKLSDMRYKMFQYWSAYDVLDNELKSQLERKLKEACLNDKSHTEKMAE